MIVRVSVARMANLEMEIPSLPGIVFKAVLHGDDQKAHVIPPAPGLLTIDELRGWGVFFTTIAEQLERIDRLPVTERPVP